LEVDIPNEGLVKRTSEYRRLISKHEHDLTAFLSRLLPAGKAPAAQSIDVAAVLKDMPVLNYSEHVLKKEQQSHRSGGEKDGSQAQSVVERYRLPLPGHSIVRYEEKGPNVVVIYASQDLDPVGEVSSGGYWVIRSENGGVNWEGPYYTGLQLYAPYVILQDSKLSLFGDGELLLEVERRELDRDSITFPPVALRAKNVL
jgi:hypothetical protein